MIAKTITAPLERLKMLSQTSALRTATGVASSSSSVSSVSSVSSASSETVGLLNITKQVLKSEGLSGLWAGNGTNLVRIFPAKAVVFGCNDIYNAALTSSAPFSSPKAISALAGGLSGFTASALTYPLDLARGRISGKGVDAKSGEKLYKGLLSTLTRTAKEEGVGALYKGMQATLVGAVFYEGIKFGTVGILGDFGGGVCFFSGDGDEDSASVQNKVARKVVYGAMGGTAAGLLTYPNDTVRRLLQLQGSKGTNTQYKGYIDCVRCVYKEAGIGRFYRGIGVNLLRMAPNTAIQFGVYEFLKSAF